MDDNSSSNEQFDPIAEGDEDLCRALWIAVIVQAFVDAAGKSSKAGNRRERIRAREWLATESPDSEFAAVCDLAGLSFTETQRRLQKLLASEYETLDFRCLTKAWGSSQSIESRARFFKRARKNANNRREAFLRIKEAAITAPPTQQHFG